jgi:hypothetical protein
MSVKEIQERLEFLEGYAFDVVGIGNELSTKDMETLEKIDAEYEELNAKLLEMAKEMLIEKN